MSAGWLRGKMGEDGQDKLEVIGLLYTDSYHIARVAAEVSRQLVCVLRVARLRSHCQTAVL